MRARRARNRTVIRIGNNAMSHTLHSPTAADDAALHVGKLSGTHWIESLTDGTPVSGSRF